MHILHNGQRLKVSFLVADWTVGVTIFWRIGSKAGLGVISAGRRWTWDWTMRISYLPGSTPSRMWREYIESSSYDISDFAKSRDPKEPL